MDMELRGFSPRTIKNYGYNVRSFSNFYNESPKLLGEKEILEYLHYCITEKKLSEGTVNFINASLKFFYTKTLGMCWNMERIVRIKEPRKLPPILSPQEVMDIFNAVDNFKHKTILMTIYSAGLRVSEVCNLKIKDIDSKNMQIIVREGKGKKDRYTLLSPANLDILREYWKRYRPSEYLFLGRYRTTPLTIRSVERVMEKAIVKAKITKAATVHTLRHCFATHLLEQDVDICYIQSLLGHASIATTSRYLHLRRMDLLNIKSPLDNLLSKNTLLGKKK